MQKIFSYFIPFLFGLLLAGALALVFLHRTATVELSKTSAEAASTSTGPYRLVIRSDADAVRAYLLEAQLHAEIYKYTNKGSYAGMCELIDAGNHFTLEQGVLRYIKAVGATGVYCATSESAYMIEAKLPDSSTYYCVDSSGYHGEQAASHQKERACSSI